MPLSIKKSTVRERCSPVVRPDTNGLKLSSTAKGARRDSPIQNGKFPTSVKRKSLRCDRCGIPLKPTNLNNTSASGCKCKIQIISVKGLKYRTIRSGTTSIKPRSIKHYSKATGDYTGDDFKLFSCPVVVISSRLRMLAEAAAMKLRKGGRIGETNNRSIKESEPEDESSGDSSSEFEDSSDEEVFEPTKTYPLRKKSRLATPIRSRRISSGSSDSSSESLPDLDFPIDRRWSVPNKDNNVNVVRNVGAVSNGSSEVRRNPIIQGPTMGSTQTKTSRKPSDDKVRSKTTVNKPRSLRSTDGSSHDRSDSRVAESSTKSIGSPLKIGKSSRLTNSNSSPDRNRVDRHVSNKATSSHDAEKSYSLRCSEKKDSFNLITADSPIVQEHANADAGLNLKCTKIVRRSRGRPRKVPKHEREGDNITAGTSMESSKSTPLTRSQRRAAQSEPRQLSDLKLTKQIGPQRDVSSTMLPNEERTAETKTSTFRLQNSVSIKQSRDAIALRARQSKIRAKSRVWQCNRNNSALKNTFQEMEKDDETPVTTDAVPVASSTKDLQPRMLTLIRSNGANADKNQLEFGFPAAIKIEEGTTSTTALIKKPAYPKAKCELCEMTFTRRFSLTKHYMTIQHKKMVHQASKSSSAEVRALAKSVPVLIRQHRGASSRKSPIAISAPAVSVRASISSSSKAQEILMLEENVHDSPCIADEDSNTIDDSSDTRQSNSPDLEMNDLMLDDNDANVEPPAVQEWISGKAIGRNDFVCYVCEEKFTKKLAFTTHLWNHREDANLNCRVCGTQFVDSDEFNHHIDNAHLVDTKFSCQFCPSTFNREDYLEKHMLSHKRDRNEKFMCSVCDKRFSAHELLLRHFDSKHLHLAKPRVQLACDSPEELELCPKIPEFIVCDNEDDDDTTTSSDEIDPEYRDQMPDIDLEMGGIPLRTGSSSENDPIPMIAPEDYGRELPVEIFNRYKQVFGNSKRKIGEIDYTQLGCGFKSRLPVTFNPNDGNLMCVDCGKMFQNRKSLLKHVNYFTQSERYSCPLCKMRFKFKHHLSRHQLRHIPQKDLMKLHAAAVRKPSFLKHRKLVVRKLPRLLPISPNNHEHGVGVREGSSHVGSSNPAAVKLETSTLEPNQNMISQKISGPEGKPIYNLFTCELCSETFTERQTLDVHTWFHQKENVYSCPDCDARCERKSDLDLHYKCHETQQPFFLCYVCFKPFRWKKDMVRHVRKKHPAERTYRCLYCSERFRKNDELTIHISNRHPEHRSFPCEYCGRRYAQKRYLLVHIQTQHGIEPVADNVHPISLHRDDDDEEVEDDEDIFLQTEQL